MGRAINPGSSPLKSIRWNIIELSSSAEYRGAEAEESLWPNKNIDSARFRMRFRPGDSHVLICRIVLPVSPRPHPPLYLSQYNSTQSTPLNPNCLPTTSQPNNSTNPTQEEPQQHSQNILCFRWNYVTAGDCTNTHIPAGREELSSSPRLPQ